MSVKCPQTGEQCNLEICEVATRSFRATVVELRAKAVRRARHYIKTGEIILDGPITLEQLANLSHMSAASLERAARADEVVSETFQADKAELEAREWLEQGLNASSIYEAYPTIEERDVHDTSSGVVCRAGTHAVASAVAADPSAAYVWIAREIGGTNLRGL